MLYNIAPSPTLGLGEHEFVTWNDGFTEEQINDIIGIGNTLEKEHSKVDKGVLSPKEIRVSEIAWVHPAENTMWIYDKISWILTSTQYEPEFSETCGGFASNTGGEPYDSGWNIPEIKTEIL